RETHLREQSRLDGPQIACTSLIPSPSSPVWALPGKIPSFHSKRQRDFDTVADAGVQIFHQESKMFPKQRPQPLQRVAQAHAPLKKPGACIFAEPLAVVFHFDD